MKTVNLNVRSLAYGVCMAAVLYNCKPRDVNSLTPFAYTFAGFEEKLPDITPTQPVAVSVTAGAIVSSAAADAVSSGLTNLTAAGPVPAAVQQAATAVGKRISTEKAAELSASFSPGVMEALGTTGELPANLKAEADAMANDPALKAYMPSFTMPTVDGRAIGARIGVAQSIPPVITPVVVEALARADDDACKTAAIAALTAAILKLDEKKQAQTNAINQRYEQAVTAAQGATAGCKSNADARYTALRDEARQQYTKALSSLQAGRGKIGQPMYNLLKLLYDVAYARAIIGINILQAAENGTCDLVTATRLRNAETARNADLNKVNGNYSNALAALTKARDKAIASCHNQGNGG